MKSIQEIGNTIKQERLKQGMTLQQLSTATGFSIGYLSQFERGLSQIAIDSLHKITDVLGMEFIDFFREEESSPSASPVTRIYDASCDKVSDQIIQYTLSKNAKNFSYLPRLYHLMPHIGADENIELYAHEGEEFIYVLEGVLKLYVEEDEYIMYPGDSVQLDSTKKHNWTNCGTQITKILTVNMPNPFK
ncbi:MAG: cupin domain-containing protein [Lachnospiraceae bacterium]|nr:cupin domain-containing protein [Lachnospiraceae bacterium]